MPIGMDYMDMEKINKKKKKRNSLGVYNVPTDGNDTARLLKQMNQFNANLEARTASSATGMAGEEMQKRRRRVRSI